MQNTTSSQATPSPEYNWIYTKLVKGPDDAVGAFAYVLYKQHKIDYIHTIKSKSHREPTSEEMEAFHITSCTDSALEGYLVQAQALVEEFLKAALTDRLKEAEEEVKEGVLSKEIGRIRDELQSKKTFKGWAKDVGSMLAVNFLTILIIALLVAGYKQLSSWNSATEKAVGLSAESPTPTNKHENVDAKQANP